MKNRFTMDQVREFWNSVADRYDQQAADRVGLAHKRRFMDAVRFFHPKPGDSVLGPRQVSHVWAFTSEGRGRILIAFMPAGKMEAFFREVTKANAMPPQDPALWRAHGMELLGPPMKVE